MNIYIVTDSYQLKTLVLHFTWYLVYRNDTNLENNTSNVRSGLESGLSGNNNTFYNQFKPIVMMYIWGEGGLST